MKPIEKNIIVVDEQGNEYEATYPKRAKGLVKNGRARFIAENKICLACPPKVTMEDSIMSENKKVNINCNKSEAMSEPSKFSVEYILEQIKEIQNELEDLRNTVNNIGCVSDTDRGTEDYEEYERVHDEVALAKIKAITEVFHHREENLRRMLDFYEKVYDDLNDESARKIDLLPVAFVPIAEILKSSDLPSEDKHAELSDITEKVAELVEGILVPRPPVPSTEQTLMFEMIRILKSPNSSPEDKENAKDVIRSYVQEPFKE